MTPHARLAAVVWGLTVTGSIAAWPAALGAQRDERPEDASRFMVHTLKSDDKELGGEVADAIRQRIAKEFSKQLGVIQGKDIKATLEASGFDPNVAPDPITARLLAQQLRADEYLDGTVTKTPKGLRAETRMVLTRDADMAQPLPPAEARSEGDIAKDVAKSLEEARKQLADVRRCETALAGRKPQEAVAAARAAIKAYPRSTLGRVCLAEAMVAMKAPNDSIIAVATEILKIDQRSKPALEMAAVAYKAAGNEEKSIEMWTTLLATDARNVRLQTRVVNELAAARRPELAQPIIERAVRENPGDPDLIRLRWLVALAAKDWKTAIQTGEHMLKSDTAAADTTFFTRLTAAYVSDSQPQKAAETTARAVAKFPNNGALWSLHAQTLRVAGQTQQSIEAAKRALAINPKLENGWVRLAQAQLEVGQTDSAMVSLQQALQNGEDSTIVGQTLLVEGNKAYKEAVASKTVSDSSKAAADFAAAREDFTRAVALLATADSVAPSPTVKFLLGASAFQLGDVAVRENQEAKSCELAELSEEAFATAQINVPAGGEVQPDAAKQLMDALGQYQPVVAAQKKRFCRSKRG